MLLFFPSNHNIPDAQLAAASSLAEQVKSVVAQLEVRQCPQASPHRKVARPWGGYDSIDNGERLLVKHITVRSGAKLSLQKYRHRAKQRIMVKGTALVARDDDETLLAVDQRTDTPLGVNHSLESSGKTDLERIKFQSGIWLGKADIVRFEDIYGRLAAQPTEA